MEPSCGARTGTGSRRQPAFASLAQQYGLPEDMHLDSDSIEQQTVEQEFQSYVTSQISPPATDIIKFWEVSYK
jgi:hypothetical protein